MKKILILLAGAPGTGKTYTSNKILQAFPQLKALPLDLFKEHIYDEIGFDNLEQKKILDQLAQKQFFQAIDLLMQWQSAILGDYPFSYKQKPDLNSLAKKHHYQVLTIRLEADLKILYARQHHRDIKEPRHLGHLVTHYHRGNTLSDYTELAAVPSFQTFQERVQDRAYQDFRLGELINIDVSDYDKINYPELINQLKHYL